MLPAHEQLSAVSGNPPDVSASWHTSRRGQRLAGGPGVDRRAAGHAWAQREQHRRRLSVPYGFTFTLSSRVTPLHDDPYPPFAGPGRRPGRPAPHPDHPCPEAPCSTLAQHARRSARPG